MTKPYVHLKLNSRMSNWHPCSLHQGALLPRGSEKVMKIDVPPELCKELSEHLRVAYTVLKTPRRVS